MLQVQCPPTVGSMIIDKDPATSVGLYINLRHGERAQIISLSRKLYSHLFCFKIQNNEGLWLK